MYVCVHVIYVCVCTTYMCINRFIFDEILYQETVPLFPLYKSPPSELRGAASVSPHARGGERPLNLHLRTLGKHLPLLQKGTIISSHPPSSLNGARAGKCMVPLSRSGRVCLLCRDSGAAGFTVSMSQTGICFPGSWMMGWTSHHKQVSPTQNASQQSSM